MTLTTKDFAVFVAVITAAYYIIPAILPAKMRGCQWWIIPAANIYFLFKAGLSGLLFVLGTSLYTYLAGLAVKRFKYSIVPVFSVLFYVALMVVMRLPVTNAIAAIGLSFYSLMCIGYVIDVLRGSVEAETNPVKLFAFVSYFPHIIQGPFDDYEKMKERMFSYHEFDHERSVLAMYRIALGVMKKLVLADRISNIINVVYADPAGYKGLTVLYAAILYAVLLYADFSGYMDIAAGVSKLLDIEITENFNIPYLSKSMAEFWRRWHMSLGLWFKNYVFYPVLRTPLCNGLRKHFKKKKNKYGMNVVPSVIGLLAVWTLIGIWHGFDWNYLCYDWFCGAVIIVSELLGPVYNAVNKKLPFMQGRFMDILRTIRTFLLVTFSFMIFRPDTLGDSFTLMRNLFSGIGFKAFAEFVYWDMFDVFLITPALIIVIVTDVMKYRGRDIFCVLRRRNFVLRYAAYVLLLVYVYVAGYEGASMGFAYSVF